jgi:23S rRNA maturation-related 3'-5' exoribonuclease YhaM
MSQKRGAPPGNKNALKHGFYAHAFTASEKSELSYDVNGQLTGEIKLLKTLINRTAEKVNHPDSEPMTFQENLSTLHIISMAISRLESLYRSNELLYSNSDSDLREFF